jgi:hypothetical protein
MPFRKSSCFDLRSHRLRALTGLLQNSDEIADGPPSLRFRIPLVDLRQLHENPVFTRSLANLPPFTMRLRALFVNRKTPISTGFLRVFSVFAGFSWIFAKFATFVGSDSSA